MTRPTLVIPIGDPAGIGPEIVAAALADGTLRERAYFRIVGHRRHLDQWLREAGVETGDDPASPVRLLEPPTPPTDVAPGKPDAATGELAWVYLQTAIDLVTTGEADGIVTAPLHKGALHAAGHLQPGQTEILAERTGSDPVMAFAAGGLRVALATTHCALADVPRILTAERVLYTVRTFAAALRDGFGIAEPRIALCGLNPHAGEAGAFGEEESRILEPVADALRSEGLSVHGPLSADALFARRPEGRFDGVVAMYHDQGLIPVKMRGGGKGVHLTLGLPFVRTSPDHGTACDIAGTGRADPASMAAAIRTAIGLCRPRAAAYNR